MKQRLNKAWKLLLSYVPARLPQSEAAVNAWVDSVIETAGYPDNASFRIAICNMVLHLPAWKLFVTKRGFITQLQRSVANQCAFNIAHDLKLQEKQREADERAKEASGEVV